MSEAAPHRIHTYSYRWPPGLGLIYWLAVLAIYFFILQSHGVSPWTAVGFWIVAGIALVSEGVYLIFLFRSPKRFDIAEPKLLIHLRGHDARTLECDLTDVFLTPSRLFVGANVIHCMGESFYAFPWLSKSDEFFRLLRFLCNGQAA